MKAMTASTWLIRMDRSLGLPFTHFSNFGRNFAGPRPNHPLTFERMWGSVMVEGCKPCDTEKISMATSFLKTWPSAQG